MGAKYPPYRVNDLTNVNTFNLVANRQRTRRSVASRERELLFGRGTMRAAPLEPWVDGIARPPFIERFRSRFRSLRCWLEAASAPYHIAGIAFLVLLPTLGGGLVVDDLLHRLIAKRGLGVALDHMFDFVSLRPDLRARFMELGLYDWWIGSDTKVSYFRPLAALTHFVDYTWWPHSAWLMHLENLAWYAAVVVAAAAFYRRLVRPAWVAGLAAALYAFDHSHAGPVAWIANRNALMSVLFGILSLIAHDRWRRDRRRAFAFLGSSFLSLALLSAEAGVAVVGYTFAYALFIDRDSRARRAWSLAPSVAVTVVWRCVYARLGHGIAGSGVSFDPLTDTGAFLQRALYSTPLLVASDVVGVPADLLIARGQWIGIAACAAILLLCLFLRALAPLLRTSHTARFLATGAIMSVAPFGATFPSDRYLFWVGLGVMGLIAQLVGALTRSRDRTPLDVVGRLVCVTCVLLRGVISPLAFPLRAAGPVLLHDEYERVAASLPDGPLVPRQTIVVINSPFDLISTFLPIIRLAKGGPTPAHFYTLYSGADSVSVTRTSEQTIEVRSTRGWLPDVTDRTFRRTPFRVGDTVDLARMRADVRGVTTDGRPDVVRFSFPDGLDDPSLVFLVWGSNGLEPFALPRTGASADVQAAPLVLAGALRPRLRTRALEN